MGLQIGCSLIVSGCSSFAVVWGPHIARRAPARVPACLRSVAAVSKLFMGLRYLLTRQGCLIFRNLHNYAGKVFLTQIKRKIVKV